MIVILFPSHFFSILLLPFLLAFISDVLPYFGLPTEPPVPDVERIVDSSPQRFDVEFLKNVDADADTEQLRIFSVE